MRVHTGLRCVTCLNTIIDVCQDLDLPLRPLAVSILSYSRGHVCLYTSEYVKTCMDVAVRAIGV